MKAERFDIRVDQELVDEMRRRIRATRWADDFGNADWSYGVEGGWLRDIATYWADEFDWRAQERKMNLYAHYRVVIDGIPIHFMHIRGKGPDPLPVICTHGWPWTFWDWHKLIEPLTDPAGCGLDGHPSFDLIIPSVPGFGFSSPLRTSGMNQHRIADLWAILMRDVLGYRRFGAMGGDVGAAVTGQLGLRYPESLIGVMITMPALPGVNPFDVPADAWAEDEGWMLARMNAMAPKLTHIGVHVHTPQTLAYGLNDSPVGTAAWIWQYRREWSDCDGDLIAWFGRDELCTLASIYWLTGTIGTSMRWYHAWDAAGRGAPTGDLRLTVPTGLTIFPKEVIMLPRAIAEQQCDLRHWKVLEKGGHFGPAEQPEALAAEVREFFGNLSH